MWGVSNYALTVRLNRRNAPSKEMGGEPTAHGLNFGEFRHR
jgi:hypothetical protein